MAANNIEVRLRREAIKQIKKASFRAAVGTANAIIEETESKGVIPMQEGALQSSAFVKQNAAKREVQIRYSTPYAWVQYFDASFRHDTGPHAGTAKDHWLEEYLPNGVSHRKILIINKRFVEEQLRAIGVSNP